MKFLPSFSCIHTTFDCTTCMLTKYMGIKLHKNPVHYSEQILEATPCKIVAVQPPTSYLTKHTSRMNKTCRAPLEKQRQGHKQCSVINSYTWTCQCWLTSKDISFMWTQDTTCQERGMDGERESGSSVMSAQLDDEYN